MISIRVTGASGRGGDGELSVQVAGDTSAAIEDVQNCLNRGFECNGGDARTHQKLLRRSATLTNLLLTAEQQQQLATFPEGTSLLITAPLKDHIIPFELLRINDQFLCERFAVGRKVAEITDLPGITEARPLKSIQQPASVFVAEAWELPGTDTEHTIVTRRLRQLTFDAPHLLSGVAEHSFRTASLRAAAETTHKQECLETLEACRWFHFAGHAVESEGVRCLALGLGNPASPLASCDSHVSGRDVALLQAAPEVVFLNACAALQLPVDDADSENSIVQGFLRRGTEWLIGPVAPVLDSQTRTFVSSFYDAIVQKKSIGEAIRLARKEAQRVLGPHNLLPLTYVLYGTPDRSAFAIENPVIRRSASEAGKPLSVPVIKTSGSRLSFQPVHCRQCGRMIETVHGLALDSAVDPESDHVCRNCVREEKDRSSSRVPKKPSTAVEALGEASGHLPVTGKVTVTQQNPILETFIPHVEECLDREYQWQCLQTGLVHLSRFRQLGKTKAINSKLSSDQSLAQLDHKPSASACLLSNTYQISDQYREDAGTLRVVIPRPPVSSVSSGSSESATSEKGPSPAVTTRIEKVARPLSVDGVRNLLAASDRECSESQSKSAGNGVVILICSTTGFEQTLLDQLVADAPPLWNQNRRVIYLHDIRDGKTYFRTQDPSSHAFSRLLQRESSEKQFQKAVQWLESQLPLVTSLSSVDVSRTLNVEADATEAAMRAVAVSRKLEIDLTEDFGLVLSETGPSGRSHDQPPGKTKPTRLQRFKKSLFRRHSGDL